jgi:hypothetical protein
MHGLIKACTRKKSNFSCNSKTKKMRRSRKTKTKKPTKNLNKITLMEQKSSIRNAVLKGVEGVITLVERDKFWLELIYDLKKAEARAEARMLGVIREAAIGNHEVTEKKVI